MEQNLNYELPEARILLKDGEKLYSTESMDSPDAAVRIMTNFIGKLDREYVISINLDVKLKPINFSIIAIGSTQASLVPIPSVYKAALLSNASNVILMHNHPSGSLEPSLEDEMLTRKIAKTGQMLDIPVLDHVIVGPGSTDYLSLRDRRPDLFQPQMMNGLSGMAVHDGETEYKQGKYPSRAERVKELTDKLQDGVQAIYESDKYKQFLITMGKFHHYSINNQILISMQCPEASCVAGYTAWQQKFNRQVRKGEKGIQILAPAPIKKFVEEKDPVTGEAEQKTITIQSYKPTTVFDVSQTEGEPLPSIGVDELKGSVQDYEMVMEAIKRAAPVSISFDDIQSGAKGYFDPTNQKIVIQKDMPEEQTIKTMLHEMAHSLLHSKEQMATDHKDANTREVEAESIAFVAASEIVPGMDTSEYSFPYVTGWSSGKETKELKSSLETIRKTSCQMIDGIEAQIRSIRQEKIDAQKAELITDIQKELMDGNAESIKAELETSPHTVEHALFAAGSANALSLIGKIKDLYPQKETLETADQHSEGHKLAM